MLFKHHIFDVDGTLIKSGDGIIYSLQHALRSVGLDPSLGELERAAFGPPLKEILRTFISSYRIRKQAEEVFRNTYDSSGILKSKLHPGVRRLLARILKSGGTVSFFSANNALVIARLLRMFDIVAVDDIVKTSHGAGKYLPKHALLGQIIAELKFAEKAVVIGDTAADFQAAQMNGLQFIGAGYGYKGPSFLKEIGVNIIANSPAHLALLLFGSEGSRQNAAAV